MPRAEFGSLQRRSPADSAVPYLRARIISESPGVADEQKIRVLEQESGGPGAAGAANPEEAWASYFLSEMYARRGGFGLAYGGLRRSLARPDVFLMDLPTTVAEGRYFCARAGLGGCENDVARCEVAR